MFIFTILVIVALYLGVGTILAYHGPTDWNFIFMIGSILIWPLLVVLIFVIMLCSGWKFRWPNKKQ